MVLIDSISLVYMDGAEIDFVDDLIGQSLQDQQSAGHRCPAAAAPASPSDDRLPPGTSTASRRGWRRFWRGSRRPLRTSSAFRRSNARTLASRPWPSSELGYNVATHGQKSYNGVAILSKLPFDEVTPKLPGGEGDDHARYLEAVVGGTRIASIYLPNGNPAGHRQIRLQARLDGPADRSMRAGSLAIEERLVLCGDYQCHSGPDRCTLSRKLGERCAVPARNPRSLPHAHEPRLDRRLPCPPPRARPSSRSGTTRPAPGRRTTASGSITSCYRRRRPTGCAASRSTSMCAAWEKPSDHVPVVADFALA